ncbi:hypothetical protein FB477_000573 [Trueperella pyogenes]|nr:hypothetical protein [Trueperella pyogenes]
MDAHRVKVFDGADEDRDVVGVPNDLELNLFPIAVFKAVCPPNVARMASGRSFAMIWATTSAVIGSM